MKIRSILAVVLLAVVGSACNVSRMVTPETAEAAFCDALNDYAVAVVNFNRLGDANTIDEYKAAAQAVEEAMDRVGSAAVDMREADVDQLQAATDELSNTINNLPQDVPISEIQTELRSEVASIATARFQLGVARCGEPPISAPSAVPAPSPIATVAPSPIATTAPAPTAPAPTAGAPSPSAS
jgi:cytochrome c556